MFPLGNFFASIIDLPLAITVHIQLHVFVVYQQNYYWLISIIQDYLFLDIKVFFPVLCVLVLWASNSEHLSLIFHLLFAFLREASLKLLILLFLPLESWDWRHTSCPVSFTLILKHILKVELLKVDSRGFDTAVSLSLKVGDFLKWTLCF